MVMTLQFLSVDLFMVMTLPLEATPVFMIGFLHLLVFFSIISCSPSYCTELYCTVRSSRYFCMEREVGFFFVASVTRCRKKKSVSLLPSLPWTVLCLSVHTSNQQVCCLIYLLSLVRASMKLLGGRRDSGRQSHIIRPKLPPLRQVMALQSPESAMVCRYHLLQETFPHFHM